MTDHQFLLLTIYPVVLTAAGLFVNLIGIARLGRQLESLAVKHGSCGERRAKVSKD